MRKRLKAAIDASAHTMATLSREAGKNHAYIQQFIERGVPRKLPEDVRVLLSARLGMPETELGGRKPIIASYDPAEFDREVAPFEPGVSSLVPYEGRTANAMPDIDVSAGAGPGGLPLPHQLPHQSGVVYAADAIRGEVILPDYLLGEYTRAKAGRVHVVRVRGDSMETTLSSGDRVFVDTTDVAIGQGGVFVILDPDGEVLIKRLRKLPEGRIEIVSDNPKQASDNYAAEEIRIVGRAVARLCRI